MVTWHLEFVYPCKNVTLEPILEEAAACIFTLEESIFTFNAEHKHSQQNSLQMPSTATNDNTTMAWSAEIQQQ
jgi:hypothetical protein